MLAVHPALPAKTVGELIALAKTSPGKLNYSSPGIGTPPHLIAELFKQRAGVDIVHVPYKGGGVASQAVIAGEVQMIFENPTTSVPLLQGGRVRGLAVTSEARNPQLPELPTMVEAGLPDFVSVSFTGVVAPAARRARWSSGSTPRSTKASRRRRSAARWSSSRSRPGRHRPRIFRRSLSASATNGAR